MATSSLSDSALTFRRYAAIEGVNHPPVPDWFEHTPPDGDVPKPAAARSFTADAGTNLLTTAAHGLLAGDRVRVSNSGGALPGGLAAATSYYVIASGLTAADFKLSATAGGSEIDITSPGSGTNTWARYLTSPVPAALFTADAATDLLTSAAHGRVAGDIVRLTSTRSLPSGLTPDLDHYVIAAGLTVNDFRLSLTPGGAALDLHNAGVGVHGWAPATNTDEQGQFDHWLLNRMDGLVTLPQALSMVAAQKAYEANPQHKAWLVDDHLQRHWEWIWRSADHAAAAQDVVPRSADITGIGSGAVTSPIAVTLSQSLPVDFEIMSGSLGSTSISVKLICDQVGASIVYRLPSGSGSWLTYSGPVTMTVGQQIEAKSQAAGMTDSTISVLDNA